MKNDLLRQWAIALAPMSYAQAHFCTCTPSLAFEVLEQLRQGQITSKTRSAIHTYCESNGLSRDQLVDSLFKLHALLSDTELTFPRPHQEVLADLQAEILAFANDESVSAQASQLPVIVNPRPANQSSTRTAFQEETHQVLNLMAMTLESIGEGIVITEPIADGKIVFVNKMIEETSGYSRDWLFGQAYSALGGKTFSQDQHQEIFQASMAGGWTGEVELTNKDGKRYTIQLTTKPVVAQNGDIVAIVGIQRDISRQKRDRQSIIQLQQFIASIINNLQSFIFVTSEDATIRFWNQAIAKASERTSSSVFGKSLYDILPAMKPLRISRNEAPTKVCLDLFDKNERFYKLSLRDIPGKSENNFTLWVLQDIHEEETLKAQITWQNQRLKFLGDLANHLNATLDIRETLRIFSEELSQIMPFRQLSILLPVDKQKRYFRLFFSSNQEHGHFPEDIVFNLEPCSVYPELVGKNCPKFIHLVEDNNFPLAPLPSPGRTITEHPYCFPIVFSNDLIAIFNITAEDYRTFSPEDLEFLEQVVGHLTVALKNCIQFDQFERRNQKLRFIYKLFERVRLNLPQGEMLRNILKNLSSSFSYTHLALYQVNQRGDRRLLADFAGEGAPIIEFPAKIPHGLEQTNFPLVWMDLTAPNPFRFIVGDRLNNTYPKFAICLSTSSSYFGEISLIGFCDHYLPDLSYDNHIEIIKQVLHEIVLALDHTYLFNKTRKAEKAWETTFNEVQIGLAVVDEHFYIKRANKSFWKIFRREDNIPRHAVSWQSLIDQQVRGDEFRQTSFLSFIEDYQAIEWQDMKSGRYLVRRFFPFHRDNVAFSGGIFTVQDITEEREKDAHIRFLSQFPEINPNLILSLSSLGQVVYCNPAATRVLGTLEDDDSPERLVPMTFLFELQNGNFKRDIAHEYIHKLNDRVYQFVAFQPGSDDNIYLYGMDIKDRLDLQEKLVQTERMRAMGEMAHGVAHDFNNLLTTILGRTQLLLLKKSASRHAKELKIIEKAAKDGAGIVKRLQVVTKRDRAKEFENLYLDELIQDSLLYSAQKLKLRTQVKGQEIQIHSELSKKLVVTGNPIELKEVFTNLIFNAFDAMHDGGELFLTTSKLDATTARIIIRDTGTGMPEEVRKKIFDPFFTTKGERGTGLGLSLVYNIITAHQGSVEVRSNPGQGTEFIIDLPLSKQRPKSKPILATPVMEAAGDIRLLVVDDEIELLETISEVLKLKYEKVDIANSGKEALHHLKRNRYDVVLTDLGMPGISGWEVARKSKEVNAESRVILVTGWGMQAEDELKHHDEYVDKIISKPYDLEQLVDVIETIRAHANTQPH